MYNWISLIGVLFLIFRIWLAEFKLVDELSFRRHYLSRIVDLHFALAWILNFSNFIFNFIVITCFPVMIVTSLWDSKFFVKFKKRSYWKKNHGWLMLERLTLHPPMLICGLYMYITGLTQYFNASYGIFPLLVAVSLVYIPFFLWDERWKARYNWPQGLVMLFLMICATIALYIVFFIFL
jgi:hypothetical protein